MSQMYTGKGLIGNFTKHSDNFEMIGERTSKQSTGNMLMDFIDVNQHQYYCETTNLFLLHHVKSLFNILMEEGITANNTSGEYLMLWYCKHLKLANKKNSYISMIL